MPDPEKRTVRAIIPLERNPRYHLVDEAGNYPWGFHDKGTETYEATFRRLGRRVIGQVLSVDVRRTDLEDATTMAYMAKPVTYSLGMSRGYRWEKR